MVKKIEIGFGLPTVISALPPQAHSRAHFISGAERKVRLTISFHFPLGQATGVQSSDIPPRR